MLIIAHIGYCGDIENKFSGCLISLWRGLLSDKLAFNVPHMATSVQLCQTRRNSLCLFDWWWCVLLRRPSEKAIGWFVMVKIKKKWCHGVVLSINTKLCHEKNGPNIPSFCHSILLTNLTLRTGTSRIKMRNHLSLQLVSLLCGKCVTTQNLAFLFYWCRKKRLQIHF